MKNIIKKSLAAVIVIAIGTYGLLVTDYSIYAEVLFAFGLFVICVQGYDLYTGKIGYINWDNSDEITLIYVCNVLLAVLIGYCMRFMNPALIQVAFDKVASWSVDPLAYFIKSIFCGIVMFLAVDTYKKNQIIGILFGIPLFIICGFQHCIVNLILEGYSCNLDGIVFVCVIGNSIGSIFMHWLSKD